MGPINRPDAESMLLKHPKATIAPASGRCDLRVSGCARMCIKWRGNAISIATAVGALSWMAPVLVAQTQVVDPSSMNNRILVGYQGWFNAPNDGGNTWGHWSRSSTDIGPGLYTVDMWPDVKRARSGGVVARTERHTAGRKHRAAVQFSHAQDRRTPFQMDERERHRRRYRGPIRHRL